MERIDLSNHPMTSTKDVSTYHGKQHGSCGKKCNVTPRHKP